MSNIFEVNGLSKSYGSFALKNVSFTLPEDCITGFIGVNGAGKTTTIRTILSLAKKDGGSVKFFGKDIMQHEHEIKNRIGVVLDGDCFYDDLSMADMKSIIAPAYSTWDEKIFRGYMEQFSLDGKQKISTLSKGMRMKFALALALSHHAELLIMDEPTSGLDPLIRSHLLQIMADYMKKDGRGVFFSTHITSDLEKVADMLVLINHGSIVFEEEKDELLDSHRIVKCDPRFINEDTRKLFVKFETTSFGCTGVTKNLSEIQVLMPDALIEKPTIEDIMLAYI